MEGVPLNRINGQVVPLISLKVLTRVSARAQMDLAFLSSDKEQLVVDLIEIEAHTSGKAVDKGILLVVRDLLVLIGHKLQFNDFFRFKFILHEIPCGDTAIR
jgi:hypothetical protein